jgi:hypothetical protein
MHRQRTLAALAALALLASLFAFAPVVAAAGGSGTTRQISSAGTTSPTTGDFVPSTDGIASPEFAGEMDGDAGPDAYNGIVDRSLSTHAGKGAAAQAGQRAKSNPELKTSFEGLNFFQQRFARGGNQFSVEPPDQGLCVGNGYLVEAVNDVFNVYNAAGVSQLPANNVGGAVDLNSFYGYPAAINRTTGVRGQFVTDPSCYYDAQTQRFYVVVLTLDTFPNGAFTHVNHLDIAVSNTPNPTGTWTIYKVDVTGDGTSNPAAANACPCLGDYPHIGADAYGFYITTNAYPWNGNGFNGAQLYAFSKRALASGAASVGVTHFDTFGAVAATSDAGSTQPGFTAWPAQSPGTSSYDLNAGGTEYLLSSNAADEATRPVAGTGGPGTSSQLVVWGLKNTSSLDTIPALSLSNKILSVNPYAIPPKSNQPGSGAAPGEDVPQGHCINDTTTVTVAGIGCWRLLFGAEPAHNEVVSKPDSNDTRMQQVTYANGKIWGALDTAVSFDTNPANNKAGIAWYIVKPDVSTGSLAAKVALQGTYGVAGTNLTYPAIGVTASGRGVIAMTLLSATDNPSAAYASIDALAGVGDIHTAAAGAAPDDGFTSYKSQVGNPPRTRWGDYGAAAVDGYSIWIASEYIATACSYATWGGNAFAGGTGTFGRCGDTRGALGNWSTRISKVTP